MVSRRLSQAGYSHLAELRRHISEFGEAETARYQKAGCHRGEKPYGRSAPEICMDLLGVSIGY